MLCINFDDSRYQALNQQILQLCHPNSFVETSFQFDEGRVADVRQTSPAAERFHNSIRGVASDAVDRELQQMGLTANRLTPEERLGIIADLEPQGVFLLKGAVKEVADALACSQATVYRCLAQVRREPADTANSDAG